MSYYLPIPGTHAWRGRSSVTDWFHPESNFSRYLSEHGIVHLCPQQPFVWTTDLDGVRFWRRWFGGSGDHRDWHAAGVNLHRYLAPFPGNGTTPDSSRNLIAHSHGLQVVLYAAADGLYIRRLITVGSPVRHDMIASVGQRAVRNIGAWLHVCSDHSDRMQWLGEIGDGVLGIVREHPLADRSIRLAGVGHSRLLTDPSAFHWWHDASLLDFIKASDDASARTVPP